MLRLFVLTALVLLCSHVTLDAAEPQQYLLRVSLTEECADAECPDQRLKELAAPNLITVDGREANFLVGREVLVGDKQLHHGTNLHFKVTRVDDTHAQIVGSLEASHVDAKERDFVVQKAVSAHFKRTVSLGAKTHTELIDSDGKKYMFDLTVEKAPEQTAKRELSDRPSNSRN